MEEDARGEEMKKFRCEFASWPTLKLPLIKWRLMHTHISPLASLASLYIHKQVQIHPVRCPSSASCHFLSTFASATLLQPSNLLSLQNVIYCPSSGYCLTADLEYISTHIWKKNFEALPKTFCRIIQRAINTIDIFGSLIWLIEGQWPNWRWMDRIPGRYQEGLHFSFT